MCYNISVNAMIKSALFYIHCNTEMITKAGSDLTVKTIALPFGADLVK